MCPTIWPSISPRSSALWTDRSADTDQCRLIGVAPSTGRTRIAHPVSGSGSVVGTGRNPIAAVRPRPAPERVKMAHQDGPAARQGPGQRRAWLTPLRSLT